MTKPVTCAYSRVTRNGVRKGKTRQGRPMVTFTVSVLIEERKPTTGNGEPLTDPDESRRKPWWIRCVVVNSQYLAQAEALAPGDYAFLIGRLERRRWKGDDGNWRDEWTLFVDSMASFIPGRYPARPSGPQTAASAGSPAPGDETETPPNESDPDPDPDPEDGYDGDIDEDGEPESPPPGP